MFPAPPEQQTLRVYVDTSVFAGCEDERFSTASRSSFERFRAGDTTFVRSALTADESDSAADVGAIRLCPTWTAPLCAASPGWQNSPPFPPCPTSERHRSHGTGPAP